MRVRSSIYPSHFGLSPGAAPVRRIKRRTSTSWCGHFGSQKTRGRSAIFESLLERDLLTHLEANPDVIEYATQPHKLVYWAPDEAGELVKRSYTPDVVARTRGGEIVVLDAKANVFATADKWRRLGAHIRAAYEADHGARFLVLTEREVRAQPRLTNCEIMLRYRGPVDELSGALIVRELVRDQSTELTIAAIIANAQRRGVDEQHSCSVLMRMALSGEIVLDLSQPLSAASRVQVGLA